ncbi:methylglyoxal synthase [Oleidesulfovibrio sp.]|uniref:methylglyoxal synthase n=1 Tax=Oleidesulfovibrio sp. TaxID=2909707 RepID=UPI003A8A3DE9
MDIIRNIGMVAHDERKQDLLDWVKDNLNALKGHHIFATGTTGNLLKKTFPELDVTPMKSGPLGGDQQLGAMISDGKLDMLFFLIDPMAPHPHDVDIKALLRLAVLYNIPAAYNRSTADFLITSPNMTQVYHPEIKDYTSYTRRNLK